MILPGATLGVLGGGQLGSMFVIAARTMGYRVTVLDPDPHSPAGSLANTHIQADYSDEAALRRMAQTCAAVTTEFESVPADSLRILAQHCRVCPSADAVAIAQNRIHEKTWLAQQGIATARFAVINQAADIAAGFAEIGSPALLKVSRFGYDGKGQARVENLDQANAAFAAMGKEACVLEELLPLETELSVVLARASDGGMALYPVAENRHQGGILDVSMVPARVSRALAETASDMARIIAEKLDYCGVLAVEFFVLPGEQVVVNEIAPRPHNSGHYTLDACHVSQFEQQVRALCGVSLGDPSLFSPVVMVNLLGDLWQDGEPRWEWLLQHERVKLHLYGKNEPRAGRKMGHFTCLDKNLEDALTLALRIKQELDTRQLAPVIAA